METIYVKGRFATEKYENGKLKAVILEEEDLPHEEPVTNPKVIVVRSILNDAAILAQQITQSIYKYIGVARNGTLYTYEDEREIKIEPGSKVNQAITDYFHQAKKKA